MAYRARFVNVANATTLELSAGLNEFGKKDFGHDDRRLSSKLCVADFSAQAGTVVLTLVRHMR